jgi:NTE family protein
MKLYFFINFYLLVSLVFSFAQSPDYENLVFEGAGIRGIAYSGVISELEQAGIMPKIKRVGGTSAGAITSLMIALGYNSKEIYEIISETKFQKFNDGQFLFVGGFYRLSKKYGWYRGNEFKKWIEKIIQAKTGNSDITFRELKDQGFRELHIMATSMNKQKLVVFSAHNYPFMKIKDAVTISMSVPFYFEAVFIDSQGKIYRNSKQKQDLDIMVDGGIIGNLPIFIFDSIKFDSLNRPHRIPNKKTIGIRIDSDEQIQQDQNQKDLAALDIHNLGDYIQAFYVLIIESLNRNTLIPADWDRTISVSSAGLGPKIKKLSTEQKQALIRSGEKHTKDFFYKKIGNTFKEVNNQAVKISLIYGCQYIHRWMSVINSQRGQSYLLLLIKDCIYYIPPRYQADYEQSKTQISPYCKPVSNLPCASK